jgi:outer membrane lipoprotein SlyB
VNVLTPASTPTKQATPSFSLAAALPGFQPGGKARVHRGVWVAVGLMGLTIVALATALVLKSSAPGAAPAAATEPAALAVVGTPAAVAGPTAGGTPAKAGTHVAGAERGTAPTAQQVAAAPACAACGVVESYSTVKVQGETNGVGAVAGGIGGAVIGSKVAGRGNHTVGGLVGAIGGGLLGNAVEKHVRVTTMYDAHVRMEDGSLRTVRQSTPPAVGARVTVDGHTLRAAPANAGN